MRTSRILVPALMLLLAAAPLPAGTLYVSTTGDDGDSGGSTDPVRTIQTAYDIAVSGDTIIVRPGNYNECVRLDGVVDGGGGIVERSVHLVSEAFMMSGDSAATTISGLGVCDAGSGAEGAVITIAGSDASVEGFTIREAGRSGVFGIGSITITNNVITDNFAVDSGGGIFFNSGTCYYGDVEATIADNTITGNTAGNGGGVFVFVAGEDPDTGCLGGDASLTVDGNTVQNNSVLNDLGLGIAVLTDSTSAARFASVVVTQNTISDNNMTTAPAVFGGGAYLSTFGPGSETIDFRENRVENNLATADGGGVRAFMDVFAEGAHSVTIAENTVIDNTAEGDGGGVHALVRARALDPGQSLNMQVRDNLVSGNAAAGSTGGGGGILASITTEEATIADAAALSFVVSGNVVVQNSAEVSGGGLSLIVSADADPNDDALSGQASARMDVSNNLVAQNVATTGDLSAVGGGIFAFVSARGDADSTLDLRLNTIADNSADDGAGGLHLEQSGAFDAVPGTDRGANVVTVNSSILSGNSGTAIDGPGDGESGVLTGGTGGEFNTDVNVRFTDWFDNGVNDVSVSFPTGTRTDNLSVDPLYLSDDLSDDPIDPDAYRPGECSPTLDAADTALTASLAVNEPQPNGNRVNLGFTGGTGAATSKLTDVNGDGTVDGIDVLRLATAFDSFAGQMRFLTSTDFDGNSAVNGDDLAYIGADFGKICP